MHTRAHTHNNFMVDGTVLVCVSSSTQIASTFQTTCCTVRTRRYFSASVFVLLFKNLDDTDCFIYHVRKSENIYDMWNEVASSLQHLFSKDRAHLRLYRGNKIAKVIAAVIYNLKMLYVDSVCQYEMTF